jgi:hypothetical protein
MSGEESPDLSPAMNRAAIPQQVDRAAEVTQEVTEEYLDIETGEVVGSTPEVERHAPALRRHREPAANRQPIVAVPVTDARRLAPGCPGPADIRDEEKPAVIDEHEMGAAPRGVVLSAASLAASTEQWRPRRARPRDARASGSSIPTPSVPSRHVRCDTGHRTAGESLRSRVAASRDPSGTLPATPLASTSSPTDASPWARVAAGVPAPAWRPGHAFPFGGRPATSGTLNSPPRRRGAPPWGATGPTSTAELRGDGASPVAWAFQEVA